MFLLFLWNKKSRSGCTALTGLHTRSDTRDTLLSTLSLCAMAEAQAEGADGAESEEPEITPVLREEQHAEQEASGKLGFHVVRNDGEDASLITLIEVKNIYTKQLPKMGAEYIVRLVMNREHKSLVCECEGKVVGAITYRPHMSQTFAEIAFCCVSATHQVQGYGTRMMNQLKEQAKREGIEYLLTYADDHAVNYFKKQGFQKQVTMEMRRWKGYIKDYNGATMMECRIETHVDYLSTRRRVALRSAPPSPACPRRSAPRTPPAPVARCRRAGPHPAGCAAQGGGEAARAHPAEDAHPLQRARRPARSDGPPRGRARRAARDAAGAERHAVAAARGDVRAARAAAVARAGARRRVPRRVRRGQRQAL